MRQIRRYRFLMAMALTTSLAVLAATSPALAASQSQEAKWFAACPTSLPQVVQCDYAKSEVGSEFQAGNITVPLNKPEILLGGISQTEAETTEFWGAEFGNAKTLKPVPQPIPGGLEGNIEASMLSGSALASYEKAIAGGKTGVTASIELAGPPHPAVSLEFFCFLSGTCPAITLPVQVKLKNVFLGNNCYIGSNSNPIEIELTIGTTSPPPPNEPITGSLGEISFGHEGQTIAVEHNKLVNNSYASPGATGCGTPTTQSQVDAAIDTKAGLPSPAGTNKAIITGEPRIAAASYVKESLRG
jgi:hypothetical protein